MVFAMCDGGDSSDSETDVVVFRGKVPPCPTFDLLDDIDHEKRVAHLPHFFSLKEVELIHDIGTGSEVQEIHDRDSGLDYKHNVWRIEKVLKERSKKTYDKLVSTAWALDKKLWGNIEKGETLYPEIEYIVYDSGVLGEHGMIGKHVDNDSMVTMVVILSNDAEYTGGVNLFESGEDAPDRALKLTMGDAVFFFGDHLVHWITPVTGRRVILQMEISTGHWDKATWWDRLFCRA